MPGKHSLALLGLALWGMCSLPQRAFGQEVTRVGTLVELWTDPVPGSPVPPSVDYFLVDDGGEWLALAFDPGILRPLGGPGALLRARVAVSGILEAGREAAGEREGTPGGARLRVTSLDPLTSPAARAAGAPLPPVRRYVTVLCRFPQSADDDIRTPETYRLWLGGAPPGMGHYWAALSGGRLDFQGGVVAGWYEMPSSLPAYFQDPLPGERLRPDWGLLARDCVGRADGDVDFSLVDGINLQFNVDFGAAWGGSSVLAVDGPSRPFGVTWMPAWSSQSTYAHEIGHTFGLPHSSGPYGETYDSQWDIMSNGYVLWDPLLDTWIGQHTISYHRDYLGWVAPERRWTADRFGLTDTLLLEVWGVESDQGWDLVRIPLFDGTSYTAEARRQVGYDEHVPFPGVLLHHVDPERADRRAQVLDADADGDPNDEGAIWIPGETFEDDLNGVTLSVVEAIGGAGPSTEGYGIEVSRGWWLDVVVNGVGRVRSGDGDGDVDCSESCVKLFTETGIVVLEAEPGEGMLFGGWGGVCSGTGACQVTLGTRKEVAADFVEPVGIASEAERPKATVGAWYNDELEATGGSGVYRWSLSGGSLPKGLILDSIAGAVTGIPEESGEFPFQVTARSGSLTATASLHLAVETPVLDAQAVIEELLLPGSRLTWDERRYLDIVGNRNGRFDLGDAVLFRGRGGG